MPEANESDVWARWQRATMPYEDFLLLYREADRWGLCRKEIEALRRCLRDEDQEG